MTTTTPDDDYLPALRKLMSGANLSAAATARLLGVDEATVRRWLHDRRATPYWAPRLLALETDQDWP